MVTLVLGFGGVDGGRAKPIDSSTKGVPLRAVAVDEAIDSSRRVPAVAAVCLIALASACLADRSLPANVGARTACTTSRDCPADFVCPVVDGGAKASCLPRNAPACGNGVLDKGESCDDGNLVSGDGCRADCTLEKCGDGILDANEKCDDGNNVSGDGCSADCGKVEACGDGVVDVGDECDDGAANADTAACTSHCRAARCGDGLVQTGVEACDDGANNGGDATGSCHADCSKRNVCGDGVVDPGEVCDDGAANGGTAPGGCHSDCSKQNACGDGVVDPGEACDDGAANGGTAAGACYVDCSKRNVCGDGALDPGEACDDANANPGDGCDQCRFTRYDVAVVTGLGAGGGDPLATRIGSAAPAVDRLGSLFFADAARVERLDGASIGAGRLVVVAGNGSSGASGDGGPATGAELGFDSGMALDAAGRVFLAEQTNNRVRAIELDGTIHTIAGTGVAGAPVDGVPALLSPLNGPRAVAVDAAGRVFIADEGNCAVRRVDVDGSIHTIAGGPDCDSPTSMFAPGVAIDDEDRLLIADQGLDVVWREDADGAPLELVAGIPGTVGTPVDGADVLASEFTDPVAVAAAGGRIFIADDILHRIFVVENGVVTTFAGIGVPGFAGDGGQANEATLNAAKGLALAPDGRVFIADSGNGRIRVVDASGVITTVVGAAAAFRPEGASAGALAVDAGGHVVFADGANATVDRLDGDFALTPVAGGARGFSGDGGPATSAALALHQIAVDREGRIVIADGNNFRIRRVDVDGTIATIAGSGAIGDSPDGSLASQIAMNPVDRIAVDPTDHIWFTEIARARVRRIADDGTVETMAGQTVGDVSQPRGLAFDAAGNAYYADFFTNRVMKVDIQTRAVTTFAGTGDDVFNGDGILAVDAAIKGPQGIAFDGTGRLLIGDGNARIRRVELDGTITTLVGDGVPALGGDGGLVATARVTAPVALLVTSDGRLFISDGGDGSRSALRVVENGVIRTVAGAIDPAGTGPLATGALASPQALIALDATHVLFAGGASGVVERISAGTIDVVAGYPDGLSLGADPFPIAGESRARFVKALGNACGIAWDQASSSAFITDEIAGAVLRLRAPDLDDASTWSVSTFATLAGACALAFHDGLFVANADTVRSIDANGAVSSPIFGVAGIAGDADDLLSSPRALAFDASGALFIADTGNHRVTKLVDGVRANVIGTGEAASSGDGAPSSTFPVEAPRGLAFDPDGNLIVTSTRTVRLVTPTNGVVDGSGSVITVYGEVPRDAFPEDSTFCLSGVDVPSEGVIRVVDGCQGFLLTLTRVRL